MAHYAGLVAAGLHDNPVKVADFVTTTTHKTLRGPRTGMAMCRADYAKDLDRNVFPGIQGGPLMHVIAGKAICFGEALRPEFKQYAQRIIDNAKALANALMKEDLRLVSGGTENHLMLVDVTTLGIGGKLAEIALDKAGITVNKNMIPYDGANQWTRPASVSARQPSPPVAWAPTKCEKSQPGFSVYSASPKTSRS